MKYRDSTGITPDASGVKFLAQALDELLYDYSLASYKPRVMGLEGACGEALVLIDQVDAEQIDRSRLEPVLEEIEYIVQSDPVAKSFLEFPAKFYTSFSKDVKPGDLRTRISLLLNKIDEEQYIVALQGKLIDCCVDDRQKKVIYQTLRRWISALNDAGYSRQYIKSRSDKFFFSDDVVVLEPADLSKFFDSFSFKVAEFEVAFVATEIVSQVAGVAERFKAEIFKDGDQLFNELSHMWRDIAQDRRVIRFNNVLAPDVFSARLVAEKGLEHLSDLLVLFHHKNKIVWDSVAFARSVGGNWILVEQQNSSVKRSRDNVPGKAGEKLDTIFRRLKFSDGDSISRFVSVVRLHGSALEAVSAEAQLVNIWTAMEVLVHREFESKLRAVVRLLTPFLIYGYIDSLLHSLAGDIYRWRKNRFYRIIKIDELKGWRTHHRLAAVLRGGEYEGRRDELYELIENFALLRNRCFQISELISSCNSLESALEEHERRVVWQIRRIYRCRNLIVHDGTSPRYLDALTENAHEYLDIFIDRFFVLCAKLGSATSLEEAAVYQAQLYDQWRKRLREGGEISPNSVREFCALTA